MVRSRAWRSSSSGAGCSRNGSSRPSGSASSSARSSARELAPVSPRASLDARFEQQRLYLPARIIDREAPAKIGASAAAAPSGSSWASRSVAWTTRIPPVARTSSSIVIEGSLHEVGLAQAHQDLQRERLRRRREDVSRREPSLDALSSALLRSSRPRAGRRRIPASAPCPVTASSPSSARRSAAGRSRRGPASPPPRRAARATGSRRRARCRRWRRPSVSSHPCARASSIASLARCSPIARAKRGSGSRGARAPGARAGPADPPGLLQPLLEVAFTASS